jgi:hypothetical protein
MNSEINKTLCENFGSFGAYAPHSEIEDSKDTIKIISRYSNFDANFGPIQNFDRLNMGLTSAYAPSNAEGQQLLWSPDDTTKNINRGRGVYDRYLWSGAVQDRGMDGFAFTSTEIDGKSTDGLAMIPCPHVDFVPGKPKYSRDNQTQNSFKIKLKFNSLPANKFVPLFGYVYSHTGSATTHSNASGNFHHPRNYWFNFPQASQWNYHSRSFNKPGAIASDDVNLYETYPEQAGRYHNDYQRNTILYFLYAHDGNGNGMIATCAGDADSSDPTGSIYRPTNEHFGVNNGFLKFQAPHVIQNYLDEGNSLESLWDYYGAGGDAGNMDWKADFHRVYGYHIEDHWGGSHYTRTQVNTGKMITGDYDRVHHAASGRTGARGGASSYSSLGSYGNNPGPLNHSNFHLLHYGSMGSNFDLKSSEEININTNLLAPTGRKFRNGRLVNSGSGNIVAGCQLMYTGKILNYRFRDVPGQMYWDRLQYVMNYRYNTGYRLQARSYVSGHDHGGHGSHAVVLRPTVEGKGEVSSVSIASYDSSGVDSPESGENYKSNFVTKYFFPELGYSYESTKYVRDNPSQVSSSTWTSPTSMFDFDGNTVAEIFNAGEDSALYVPLRGSDVIPGTSDDAIITEFAIMIRGVSAASFKEHKLKLAVVDSAKTSEVFTDHNGTLDDIEIPVNSSTRFPTGDGAFTFKFISTEAFPIKYSDIKECFLKIWPEEK